MGTDLRRRSPWGGTFVSFPERRSPIYLKVRSVQGMKGCQEGRVTRTFSHLQTQFRSAECVKLSGKIWEAGTWMACQIGNFAVSVTIAVIAVVSEVPELVDAESFAGFRHYITYYIIKFFQSSSLYDTHLTLYD